MTNRIPVAIYTDDRLDADARARLEETHTFLQTPFGEKMAAAVPGGLRKDLAETAIRTLVQGGTMLGVGAASAGAVRGAAALKDKITRGRDLKKIMDVYPELADSDEKEVHLAYNSLRHLNPHFAKDPLVGGTLLKQILRSREPGNPRSIQFNPDLASGLARVRPRETGNIEQLAVDSFTSSLEQAMKQRDAQSAAADERSWRQVGEKAKQDAEHAFKAQQARDQRAYQSQLEKMKQEFHRRSSATQQRRAVELEREKARHGTRRDIVKSHYSGAKPLWDDATPEEVTRHLRNEGMISDRDLRP